MGLLRAIERAAPLLVAGLAAGWYLRRQGLLGGQRLVALPGPPGPSGIGPVAPPESPEPDAVPDERGGEAGIDAHFEAVEAVSDAADVTAVVEDLLAAAPSEQADEREERIVDAQVVDEPDERRIAEAVRVALAEQPGLLAGSVEVDVRGATVSLRGQLDEVEAIAAAGHRAAAVEGVREVRNLLQLGQKPSA